MKTLKRSIIVLVCLILFASCTQTQRIDYNLEYYNIELRDGIKYYKKTAFTGEIFRNFENGQLESRENYKNGIKEGLYVEYYKNGQVELLGKYNDGNMNGEFEKYYENGQLESRENYKNGIKEGLYVEYYKNGQVELLGKYSDGNMNGVFEKYYENGQLESRISYKNDRLYYIYDYNLEKARSTLKKWQEISNGLELQVVD